MNKEQEIEIDDILIGKYLSGEATPEEAVLLDNWRSRSPENQRRFDEACRIWNNAGPAAPYDLPQPETKWNSIDAASALSKPTFRFWKIAAAVMIIITGAAFGYFFGGRPANPEFVSFMNAKEGTATDTLPDRSVVTLIQGTELDISRKFGTGTRAVQLRGGEGYFVVKKSAGAPFIIHVSDVRITVLGTAFDVNDDSDAVTVAVTVGNVKMETNDQTVVVTGGSTATYVKKTRELRLYRDSLDENGYSYSTGILQFDDMSLAEVQKALEKTYGVRVHFGDASLESLRINTRFYHQPLEYVLKVMSRSLNIQYRIEGRNVYFFDKNVP